ncbi:MAG: ribosome maturation factor RimM [Actinomycetota bacterium]|nr:ribosome maturation factor RimM [Actinomycetota bacterium]
MSEPTIVVGKVAKAHGLRGEVTLMALSDNPDRFVAGSTVYTEAGRELHIRSCRGVGARLLVTFEGVEDRARAESLHGAMLVVPRSMLPTLPAGEYWPHELEGCAVVTESGRALGTITDVIPNQANDLWVAADAAGTETLIPAIRDVIVEVDVASKRVSVRDVPGITAPED